MSVVLRPGTPDDAAALHELGRRVTAATYEPIDPAYAAYTLEEWWSEAHLSDSLVRIPHVVAEDAGELVGVANLGRTDDRSVMWKLYVAPGRQGNGLGSRLLAAVEAQVPEDELWLEYVDGNDRAASFYRAKGFVEDHREPTGRFPDLVWMRKKL